MILAVGMGVLVWKAFQDPNDENRRPKRKFASLGLLLQLGNTAKYWSLMQYLEKAYMSYWDCQANPVTGCSERFRYYNEAWVIAEVSGVFVAKACSAVLLFDFTYAYMMVSLQLRRLDYRLQKTVPCPYTTRAVQVGYWLFLGVLIGLQASLQALFPNLLRQMVS